MVITEPVERSWKRLGEILKPYGVDSKGGNDVVSGCISVYTCMYILVYMDNHFIYVYIYNHLYTSA